MMKSLSEEKSKEILHFTSNDGIRLYRTRSARLWLLPSFEKKRSKSLGVSCNVHRLNRHVVDIATSDATERHDLGRIWASVISTSSKDQTGFVPFLVVGYRKISGVWQTREDM